MHCDWHADSYIRVYILDKIFGESNFRNHIVWQRTKNPKGSQFEKKNLGIATDTIFWYSKSSGYFFNELAAREQLQNGDLAKKYPFFDEKGRYYQGPVIRGASMGTRPNLVYEYKGFTPKEYGWRMTKEKLIELDKKGDLGWSSNYKPFRKLRPESDKGNPIYNLWYDINRLYSNSKESIGYPTQKPEKLLDRILLLNSKEDDTVLDPFVGGGTTLAVADKLKRNWIGIDQSVQAVKVSEMRLNKQQGLFSPPFTVTLHKYDYDTLRYKDAFEFESWIITQFGGIPQGKKGADFGFDGKTKDGTPIQVKRSDNVGINVVKNFLSSCQINEPKQYEQRKEKGEPIGYIIAFSFSKASINEVAKIKNEIGAAIELIPVDKIVAIAKKPNLTVDFKDLGSDSKGLREIEFTAKADTKIEIFAWDWDYKKEDSFKAEILLDKSGKQKNKFKPGTHNIAVKAVDEEGLEVIEIIKLKVNGETESC